MEQLFRFFSPDAIERRGRAAADFGRDLEQYIPPNLRPLVGLLVDSNPVMGIDRAGDASARVVAPDRSVMERIGDLGEALSETAGVVAPMGAAAKVGRPAAEALQEGLLGMSVPARSAAQAVIDRANQPGPVPTMYSNPVMSVAEMRRQANIERFGYDPSEAPVQQAGSGVLSDYVGQHRAPMRDEGAPAFDLAGDIYPDDIYSSKAVQYYGTGSDAMDKKTMGLLQSLRGKPDADVTIYRAVPKGVDNLNAGDWVTVSKQYAEDHGESALGGDFDIIEKKVKAKDIFTNGDSIHEFGYDPNTPAQEVAGLLSSGRADEVTDEMLAKFTPKDEMEIFDLYQRGATGMDLPMDEASRMARAREMGRQAEGLHGTVTGNDFSSFRGDRETYIAPVSQEGLDLVSQFSSADQGRVFPLMHTSDILDTADPSGMSQQRRNMQALYDENNLGDFKPSDKGLPHWSDMQAINVARDAGYGGIKLEERDWVDSTAVFDPSNIRSRFARFDPRLAHLRNLSAGVGGLGLLSTGIPQEEQY